MGSLPFSFSFFSFSFLGWVWTDWVGNQVRRDRSLFPGRREGRRGGERRRQ